jgi:hypothetical protein
VHIRQLLFSVVVTSVFIALLLTNVGQPSLAAQGIRRGFLPTMFSPPPCTKIVNPGESIQAAIDSAVAGSTICVRGGSYAENFRVRPSASNLIITAYPGERPIIDGQRRLPGDELGTLIRIEGQNITLQGFEVRSSTGRGVMVNYPADTVTVRDIVVHDNWQTGIQVKGQSNSSETSVDYVRNVTIEDNHLYYNVRKAKYSPVVYLANRTGSGPADWQFDPNDSWDSPFWEGSASDLPEVSLDGVSLILDGAGAPQRVYVSTGSTFIGFIQPAYSADGQEIAYTGHDILYHAPQTNKWTLFFDGSLAGLPTNANVDAVWVDSQPVAGGCSECFPILISFDTSVPLPGLGLVGPGDIVQFTPIQTGRQTRGKFTLYHRATELGLGSANIDVIDLAAAPGQTERQLVVSTTDNVSIPGGLAVEHQDLVAYNQLSATWTLYFDHSVIPLNPFAQGMTAAWVDNTGNIYISGNPAGGSALSFVEAQNSVARRNVVHENWGEGLVAGRLSDHVTLEDNVSWDNLHANLYMNATTSPVANGNLLYCTANRAFWRKVDNPYYRAGPGLIIRDELLKNGNVSISEGQVVVNNIVIGCGRNFHVSSQHENGGLIGAVIANNTFFEAQGEAGSGSVNVRFEGIAVVNSLFANNLLYQSAGEILRVQGGIDLPGLAVSNNLYYPAASPGWKSGEPGRIVGNPLLVNPSIQTPPDPGWYMLQAASPAIDRAIAVTHVVSDFFDNSRQGLPPDIGAHEHSGARQGVP